MSTSIVNYEPALLKAAVHYWQRIFRMQDWNISVLFVLRETFHGDDTVADTNTDSRHRQAVIRVCERLELDEGFALDYRNAIAHEFTHVLLWDIPRPGKDNVPNWLFEQTVEMIGRGIAAMTPWDNLR